MKKLTSTILVAAFVAALALTQFASAQTTNTYTNTNATGVWTNTANWTGGAFPNAAGSVAIFTTAKTVLWTNTNIAVGSILASNTSGNVVIGQNDLTNDVLTLDSGSATKPTLFVNTGGSLFMYANVAGTNGFNKTGSGKLTFRFNTHDMTYSGGITITAGTLGIDRDGSLGNTNNDLTFAGSSTLLIEPGANSGTITLGAGRDITLSSGTATINNGNAAVTTIINGIISGSGNLTFGGTGTLTLNGANSYTGNTTIQGGTFKLGSGSRISTNQLSFSGGTTYLFDLGGNSQTNGSIVFNISTTTARTWTFTNGTYTVAGGSFNLTNSAGGSSIVMSGLSNFIMNSAGSAFTVTPTNNTTGQTNSVFLANTGAGSNSITASSVTVGGAGGTSAGDGHRGNLFLGKINEINTASFAVGGFNGTGEVSFQSGVVDGSVKLRGTNGSTALPILVVGNTSSGTRRGSGTLDLGIADAVITDTIVGNMQANGVANLTQTSSITMAGGNFTSANLYLGTMTNPAGTGNTLTNVTTFQQNGGTSSITLLRMGDNRATDVANTIAFQSSYNLVGSGALLRAQTIDAGTNSIYGANAFRTLTMSNGATLRNASGADLSVNGFANTAAGRIGISLAGNGTVEADSGQSVTFGANTLVSGVGALTKTGAGTLVLQASNSHSGGTTLSDGTIEAAADAVLGSGTIGLNGGALVASGAARSYTNAVSVGGNVTLGGSGNALTFSGPVNLGGSGRTLTISDNTTISGAITNGGLTKEGSSTLTLSGANSYSGGTVVSAGALVASGSALQGAVTNNSTLILSGAGTYAGSMSGTGSLTKEGVGTYTLSGTSDFSGATTVRPAVWWSTAPTARAQLRSRAARRSAAAVRWPL